jgi:hypothetical protein
VSHHFVPSQCLYEPVLAPFLQGPTPRELRGALPILGLDRGRQGGEGAGERVSHGGGFVGLWRGWVGPVVRLRPTPRLAGLVGDRFHDLCTHCYTAKVGLRVERSNSWRGLGVGPAGSTPSKVWGAPQRAWILKG